MNDLVILVYLICFAAIVGMTFAFMWRNMSDILRPKKFVTHPELKDTKNGDELLVVKFKPEIDKEGTIDIQFTPDKKFEDLFLEKSLQKRIEELDDEDDDDGDIVVRR